MGGGVDFELFFFFSPELNKSRKCCELGVQRGVVTVV